MSSCQIHRFRRYNRKRNDELTYEVFEEVGGDKSVHLAGGRGYKLRTSASKPILIPIPQFPFHIQNVINAVKLLQADKTGSGSVQQTEH